MSDAKQDYYATLGIDKSASEDDIKKAYKTLAKKYHPDLNPGDATAEQKFKDINEAYEILSDKEKRQQYDMYGQAAFDPSSFASRQSGFTGFPGFDFSDIFNMYSSAGSAKSNKHTSTPGENINQIAFITLEEAAFGCKKSISYIRPQKCSACDGTGSKNKEKPITCPDCNGTGTKVSVSRSAFGIMQQVTPCIRCRGTGEIISKPCPKCKGARLIDVSKILEITIPAGVDTGTVLTARKQGGESPDGGETGNLYINISVLPHKIFTREHQHLFCEVPISFADAALGRKIKIPLLNGSKIDYQLPAGTQTGEMFKLSGKGIPYLNDPDNRCGDLMVQVKVVTPTNLTSAQVEALKLF